jgi:hypothetical protein
MPQRTREAVITHRARALALWLSVAVHASAAVACPFCGVVGQSLAQRRDEAAAVAVGEVVGAAVSLPDVPSTQRFRVAQVLRPGANAHVGDEVTATVTAPVMGTAVLFATAAGGPAEVRWNATAADEAVLGYVAAAPAWDDPPAARLRWYAPRLEHPDPTIAADAFTEFGLARYADVYAAGDAFDADRLREWVVDPAIDPRRRGFYGLALGIVAARMKDAARRQRNSGVVREAIAAPASDFRAGFDGLLGGLLVAEGEAGLAWLETRGLFAPTARPADQKHLLAALRFAWEELPSAIPRERIAGATATLLASPVTAADAAIDLARYGAWTHAAAVADLWDSLGRDDPLVRRAVAGYLTACPHPEAGALLEDIRRRDPARLAAARAAAALPK